MHQEQTGEWKSHIVLSGNSSIDHNSTIVGFAMPENHNLLLQSLDIFIIVIIPVILADKGLKVLE